MVYVRAQLAAASRRAGARVGIDFRLSRTLAILTAVRAIALSVLLLGGPPIGADEAASAPEGFSERPEDRPELVDEDEEFNPRKQTYAFNPVQARNELKVGNHYFKKGSHKAAAGRYLEATRWDSNFGEAYWRLGLAREELGRSAEALEAYTNYLAVEPNGNRASQARARSAKLRKRIASLPLTARDEQAQGSP